jgi:hypothetical protein
MMKAVMRELAQAKRHYARLPLHEFLRYESIAARDRLAFLPCVAPLVLALPDFNRQLLRDESARDPWQRVVNEHVRDDDRDWRVFLEDFAKLGFDRPTTAAQVMRGWQRDDARESRLLGARLAQVAYGATPIEKLVIVEALDLTAQVFFTLCAPLAAQIHAEGGPELHWVGQFHFAPGSSRPLRGLDPQLLESITLEPVQRVRCLGLAFRVFDLFADWSAELHAYAKRALEQRSRVQLAHGLNGRSVLSDAAGSPSLPSGPSPAARSA